MKIGILTYHDAVNYGAVLQAYALQKVLESMDADTVILDYSKPARPQPLKTKISAVLKFPVHNKTSREFARFRSSYLTLTAPITGHKQLTDEISKTDAVIVGSDQVFNPRLNCADPAYFLNLPVSEKTKKYSYAASFGRYDFTPEEETLISSLEDFDAVSVRETEGISAARRFTGCPVKKCLDPVLLLAASQWKSCADISLSSSYPEYVLLYLVGMHDQMIYETARLTAQKYGCPVLWISDSTKIKKGIHVLHSCSPQQFIGLMMGAKAIVTNSFHATAFSVIFRRPYDVDIENAGLKHNNRSEDLLLSLKLPLKCTDSEPDWDNAHLALDEQRRHSLDYLQDICKRRLP
ncbi:MAG: polysaccharide pyruvyl transferase family protein [Oscillospiraceae bacterium]|nr:polysaccharide pyruvyl transferase family protein [Oscillospiraceae bacterium]